MNEDMKELLKEEITRQIKQIIDQLKTEKLAPMHRIRLLRTLAQIYRDLKESGDQEIVEKIDIKELLDKAPKQYRKAINSIIEKRRGR